MDKIEKKYIALMPVVGEPLEINLPTRPIEEVIEELKLGLNLQSWSTEKPERLQNYLEIELSQETFDFIQAHANIEIGNNRERYYVINKLRFLVHEK